MEAQLEAAARLSGALAVNAPAKTAADCVAALRERSDARQDRLFQPGRAAARAAADLRAERPPVARHAPQAVSAYGGPLESSFEPVFAALHLPWTPAGPSRTIAIVLAASVWNVRAAPLVSGRPPARLEVPEVLLDDGAGGARDPRRGQTGVDGTGGVRATTRGRPVSTSINLGPHPPAVMKVQARDTATATFTAALDALVIQLRERPVDPGRDSRRQPVARHRLGQVRYRSPAGDGGRSARRTVGHRALRRRRERPRPADAARGVPQAGRGRRAPVVHALIPGQEPPAVHPRRHHRRALRTTPEDWRARHAPGAAARGTCALPPLYKAHKFLDTRGDLDYTALWILYAATPLAQIEVISPASSWTVRSFRRR